MSSIKTASDESSARTDGLVSFIRATMAGSPETQELNAAFNAAVCYTTCRAEDLAAEVGIDILLLADEAITEAGLALRFSSNC